MGNSTKAVHMDSGDKIILGGKWETISMCIRYGADVTTDSAKVTCKQCLKSMAKMAEKG